VARAQLNNNRLTNWQTLFQSSPMVEGRKHFGGGLAVHEGFLYVALGEHYTRPEVQDLSTHMGKVIRLHDDGGIPVDNPFIGVENALPEIYALGLRNPQNIAIDKNGNIWAVEHGPSAGDELNLILPGANFGWPLATKGTEYNGKPVAPNYKGGVEMIDPIHDFKISVAPSGLVFYDHELIPFWRDNLLVTTLIGAHLSRLVLEDNKVTHEERLFSRFKTRLRDVQLSSNGCIYLLTEDGRLIKIDAAAG
ncbi:MAG: PQQ-dependent sugar dehydrogenase, partial [Pseudomonadales bacterium]